MSQPREHLDEHLLMRQLLGLGSDEGAELDPDVVRRLHATPGFRERVLRLRSLVHNLERAGSMERSTLAEARIAELGAVDVAPVLYECARGSAAAGRRPSARSLMRGLFAAAAALLFLPLLSQDDIHREGALPSPITGVTAPRETVGVSEPLMLSGSAYAVDLSPAGVCGTYFPFTWKATSEEAESFEVTAWSIGPDGEETLWLASRRLTTNAWTPPAEFLVAPPARILWELCVRDASGNELDRISVEARLESR